MMLLWKIRYLDRNDRRFKDRFLYLRTETLEPATRAAIELVTEAKTPKDRREILRFKHLFVEGNLDSSIDHQQPYTKFCTVGPSDYFEDETGAEIRPVELRKYLEPEGSAEPEVAEPLKPIPLASVTLSREEVRLLGYFTRDHRELAESAFMKEGPGTISTSGSLTLRGERRPEFRSALSDEEVRSFVTIFRRLYMEKEPANLQKAVDLFVRVIGDHPYARLVAGCLDEYQERLATPPNGPFFVKSDEVSFTTRRLIDVFLYTQYAHQPDERRERQFGECLAQVGGSRSILTWLFFYGIWDTGIHIGNAGRFIDTWFRRYCTHHGITPDVLDSIRHDGVRFGAVEKEGDRKARLFREKVEELEVELWKCAGRPEGGPVQFRAAASEQLRRALRGEGAG